MFVGIRIIIDEVLQASQHDTFRPFRLSDNQQPMGQFNIAFLQLLIVARHPKLLTSLDYQANIIHVTFYVD